MAMKYTAGLRVGKKVEILAEGLSLPKATKLAAQAQKCQPNTRPYVGVTGGQFSIKVRTGK